MEEGRPVALLGPCVTKQPRDLKEGVDYYYEGPYMVFTEHYLRARGYCCNSGCRHCPWSSVSEAGRTRDDGDR